MNTETIDKLFLELSQVTKAKTKRELELEDLLCSARAIAKRKGTQTNWDAFDARCHNAGVGSITAKSFKLNGEKLITTDAKLIAAARSL